MMTQFREVAVGVCGGGYPQSDFDRDYSTFYGHGVSMGIGAAYATPRSYKLKDQRGHLCPCQGDRAVHRGFKAGWTSVRKVAKA